MGRTQQSKRAFTRTSSGGYSFSTRAHRGKQATDVCLATGKRRFRERNDAKDALVGAAYTRNGHAGDDTVRRHEIRAYLCDDCHGWHLTSHPDWSKAA